jgi:hypothetical protein
MSSLKAVAEAAVAKQFRADVAKATKYRNVPTTVEGIVFASKWEAHRWTELRLEEKAGFIRKLVRQRPFAIVVNEMLVCQYVADFVYERLERFGAGESWQRVVEDAKGMRTEMYRLKKKLMRACLGVEIHEVRRERNRE